MKLITETAKVAGNPGSNGCSQSYDITSEDPNKKDARGDLHLTVSIKDVSDHTQSIFIIRGIAAQIQKKFYDNNQDGVLEALRQAVSNTIETYQKEIEIASAVIFKDNIYIVTLGTAKVILKRGEKLAVFESPNGAVRKAAGKLKPGDLLVLATKSFVEQTPQGVLNAALDKSDPQQIVEFLAPGIQSKENNSTICASFLMIGGTLEQEASPVEYPKINTAQPDQGDPPESSTETESTTSVQQQKEQKGLLDKIRSRRFYVKDFQDEKANKRRRVFSLVGMALILVLAGTVAFGLYKKQQKERQEIVQEVSSSIDSNLKEAEEIFSYSPQRAQELIQRSRDELVKLEDPELGAEDRIASLRQKIDNAEGNVLGMHSPEANDFLDLDLLSEGFLGDRFAVYNSEIYVLDTDSDRLISVNVENKRSEVLAGKDELDGVKDVAAWSEDVFVLKDDGIYDLDNNKLLDSDWSANTLMESYIGNIYLLDKGDSEIIRYSIDGGDLVSRTSWLSDEVEADFSKISSWGIDGAIWLSSDSGAVYKYTFGYQQNFALGKVAPEISEAPIISASNDNQYLYLLDKSNQRILVFGKEGRYIEQYNQEVIKDATDIAVFEDLGKIILLTGSRLKYIDLQ